MLSPKSQEDISHTFVDTEVTDVWSITHKDNTFELISKLLIMLDTSY